MSKHTHFFGQPIFSQLLSLIDRRHVGQLAKSYQADRYYKTFSTWKHLISMLYCSFSGATAIRELTTGLLACQNKLAHLGIQNAPKRSTLSDGNKNRPSELFRDIYLHLFKRVQHVSSDSRIPKHIFKRLFLVDSTVFSLFKNILAVPGRPRKDGRSKGGIKAHTMVSASTMMPTLVRFSAATRHDHTFLAELSLATGSYVVMDKGYTDYLQYLQWSQQGVYYITRLRENAAYQVIRELQVPKDQASCIHGDQIIELSVPVAGQIHRLQQRKVAFWDSEKEKYLVFLTNNIDEDAQTIADIYHYRWQIELLFKKLKQNYPLKYFLGDNQNAIEIQIWCNLIALLLTEIIRSRVTRKWAFSNMAALIRFHLMNYVHLIDFLSDPDKALLKSLKNEQQLSMFPP